MTDGATTAPAAAAIEPPVTTEEVVVLDYGGQYSQLIARRVRELGVFSELLPHHAGVEAVAKRRPRGLILSGGPASPVAALESVERGIYGIQFHPEVVHTPYGQQILERFLADICVCERTWSPASIVAEQIERIRAQVGDGRVICGLSGGVDSSVAAVLVHPAVGDQLTCVFVDHGLMRRNEGE